MLLSKKAGVAASTFMEFVACPCDFSDLELVSPPEFLQTRYCGLPAVLLVDQFGEIISHELVNGRVSVKSELLCSAQQIIVNAQREVRHKISVARIPCYLR